jgi:hypothetical protein
LRLKNGRNVLREGRIRRCGIPAAASQHDTNCRGISDLSEIRSADSANSSHQGSFVTVPYHRVPDSV